MAVGDSITTYRYSYAELLEAMIAARRPDDNIQFVNEGRAGYTSTHGLESTYTQFLVKQPDLVFVMFGVNDCKHLGGREAGTLVSIDAYRHNITGIVRAFVEHTLALPVLLTPTPVVESLVSTNADFSAMHLTWDNTDIEACADVVRDVADRLSLPVVDLMSAFGPSPDPSLYVEDGVHPGPTGHRLIAQCVIGELIPNHA
jgi:lysophospholipase L1-like esterase